MATFSEISPELHFHRARVYKRGKFGDDRLQVRILPHFADIPDSELKNLPKFPCLFKNQVINCRQEAPSSERYSNGKSVDGFDEADYVCVLCNDDFTYGYVVCLESVFYDYQETAHKDSWGFQYVRDYINNRGLGDKNFSYDNLVVQNMANTEDGGMLEFYNWKNGNKYIINRSGTCLMLLQDKAYIRVGSPSSTPGKKSAFSAIEITSGKILMKTTSFDIDAENVTLGRHGQYLLGTAVSSPFAAEGRNFYPVRSIQV